MIYPPSTGFGSVHRLAAGNIPASGTGNPLLSSRVILSPPQNDPQSSQSSPCSSAITAGSIALKPQPSPDSITMPRSFQPYSGDEGSSVSDSASPIAERQLPNVETE